MDFFKLPDNDVGFQKMAITPSGGLVLCERRNDWHNIYISFNDDNITIQLLNSIGVLIREFNREMK